MKKWKLFGTFVLIIFSIYFFILWWGTESIRWALALAVLVAGTPIIIAYIVSKLFPKECFAKNRKPYVIGNSDKIEYLTEEELEEKLEKSK